MGLIVELGDEFGRPPRLLWPILPYTKFLQICTNDDVEQVLIVKHPPDDPTTRDKSTNQQIPID